MVQQINLAKINEFFDEELAARINSSVLGYYIIYTEAGEGVEREVAVIQKFPNTIRVMMNKEEICGLRIRWAKELWDLEAAEGEEGAQEPQLGQEYEFLQDKAPKK